MWPFKPKPEPRVHVVPTESRNRLNSDHLLASALKRTNGQRINRGMWVTYSGGIFDHRVGILKGITVDDVCSVVLVDEKGENLIEVMVPATALRQSTWLEIPEARRPDHDTANRLGYAQ